MARWQCVWAALLVNALLVGLLAAPGVAQQQPLCFGDCNGDGIVFGDEITRLVNIVAGNVDASTCPGSDPNCDCGVPGAFGCCVTRAINNLANGCPGSTK